MAQLCGRLAVPSAIIFTIVVGMEHLSPEDLQAIVTGVASNRELISGIVSQLRDALQTPPSPASQQTPATMNVGQLQSPDNSNHHSGGNTLSHPGRHNSPVSNQPTTLPTVEIPPVPQEELPPNHQPGSSHQEPPVPLPYGTPFVTKVSPL